MLTDAQCKGARAAGKAYKLTDSRGLHLYVSTAGGRSWRHKYRFGGLEKLRTLGTYPAITLKEARELRDADKRVLAAGRDPMIEAKREALATRLASSDTFETLAREWHGQQKSRWKPVHAAQVLESLVNDVFNDLGSLSVTQIDVTLVLATLQKVEKRGAIETAHRLRQRISAVFCYAIAIGRASNDPAAPLAKVLKPKPRARRWPAVTAIEDARRVLAISDTAEATPLVKLASRFLALTAQRPGMLRWMCWSELSGFDPARTAKDQIVTWIVPAGKMKQEISLRGDDAFNHPVPLADSSVAVLLEAWSFSSGSQFVFPGHHSLQKPMSENALSYLYLREGLRGRHVPHGWRSAFSTIMNEWIVEHGGPRDPLVVDLMLAHLPTSISASELRYNRAKFVDRRRALATIWADTLLKGAAPVDRIGDGRRRRRT